MLTYNRESEKSITAFEGNYAFLSNFYPAVIEMDGIIYPCVEHAYQAAKTLDPALRQRISKLPSAAAAKRYGGQLSLRPDWLTVRLEIMRSLLKKKFDPLQHPDLVQQLLQTGNKELIEGNMWGDRFWGKCSGYGQNQLGLILMELRRSLRPQQPHKSVGSVRVFSMRTDQKANWPKENETVIRIDRANQVLGNPYILHNQHDKQEREQVIAAYISDSEADWQTNGPRRHAIEDLAERVKEGEYIALACWCKPRPCHGDWILNKIKDLLNGAGP